MSEPPPIAPDPSNRPAPAAGPAWEHLTRTLYGELRDVAAGMMRHERHGHTLQPTAIVNEACLRLARSGLPEIPHHQQLAIAARVMEQVLVDHARKHNATKRGGGAARVRLDAGVLDGRAAGADEPGGEVDIDVLRGALAELRSLHPRQAEGVLLRIMAGMTSAQVAESLGVSPRTAEADWAVARAWLMRRLKRGSGADGSTADAGRDPHRENAVPPGEAR